jgi:hypothetical protein
MKGKKTYYEITYMHNDMQITIVTLSKSEAERLYMKYSEAGKQTTLHEHTTTTFSEDADDVGNHLGNHCS